MRKAFTDFRYFITMIFVGEEIHTRYKRNICMNVRYNSAIKSYKTFRMACESEPLFSPAQKLFYRIFPREVNVFSFFPNAPYVPRAGNANPAQLPGSWYTSVVP